MTLSVAILDANVLYPAPLRDYILNLAELDLFQPKWTDEIHEEWMRTLLLNRPDLKKKDLERTKNAMNAAFPDAVIRNYENRINDLVLPDPNDRHILAAAIKGKANMIITANLKDFPQDKVKNYDILILHPDDFISNLIDHHKDRALKALHNQAARLKNPPIDISQILENLAGNGLTKSVARLHPASTT